MLNSGVLATIPASDIDRAKTWYRDKLGLAPTWEGEPGSYYRLPDGSGFLLYPTTHAGKAPNTLMSFAADDVDAEVAALKQKGVVFLDLDEGSLKTSNSVATVGNIKAAWFNDSEGNILAVGNKPA